MAEISNKALALLVLAALVVVVAATTIQLNQLNAIGFTGMPTGEGQVNLTIASSLAIEVDEALSEINFNECTPPSSGTVTFNSRDNMTDGENAVCDIQDDSQSGYIRVRNIGNENALVNVSALDPNDWISSVSNGVETRFEMESDPTHCTAGLQDSWTDLDSTERTACANLGFPERVMDFFIEVTIPSDALPGEGGVNTITFSAIIAP